MNGYTIKKFPDSRIATIDVCELGLKKHHIAALLEVDVTGIREKIKEYRKTRGNLSFSAWLVKVIGATVYNNKSSAAFLSGSRKLVVFDDVNVSFLVEKELNGQKVPFPVLLKRVNETDVEDITRQLKEVKDITIDDRDIVLNGKSTRLERLYYRFPGFMRRKVWKLMLSKPDLIFSKMGNVAVTSVGMMGRINGWFIPISVHPLCFGIGSVIKKPAVSGNEIVIREIMNLTVLIDHDVLDGAPMARFICELSKNIEEGMFL